MPNLPFAALLAVLAFASPAPAQVQTWRTDITGYDPADEETAAVTAVDGRVFAAIPTSLQGRTTARLECRDLATGDLIWGRDLPWVDEVWGATHQGDGSSFVTLKTERAGPNAPARRWLRRFSAATGQSTQRLDLGLLKPVSGSIRSMSLTADAEHTAVFLDQWSADEVLVYRFEIEGLELAWRTSVRFGSMHGEGSIQVSGDGQRVVTAGCALEQNSDDDDPVWACLDGETGEELWQQRSSRYDSAVVFAHLVSSWAAPGAGAAPDRIQYRIHVLYFNGDWFVDTRDDSGAPSTGSRSRAAPAPSCSAPSAGSCSAGMGSGASWYGSTR